MSVIVRCAPTNINNILPGGPRAIGHFHVAAAAQSDAAAQGPPAQAPHGENIIVFCWCKSE